MKEQNEGVGKEREEEICREYGLRDRNERRFEANRIL